MNPIILRLLRRTVIAGCVLFSCGPQIAMALEDPVKIDSGYIAGTMAGDPANPVRIYRGIPYAAPPVGELRWKPPQPVESWQGIREVTKLTPWAAQRYPSVPVFEVATDDDMSEDCLYLNVLTPAKGADDKLPVMVWLHGGGLDILSGNMLRYNEPDLAARGAVVVNVNHRLNVFGFLAHPWLRAESPHNASGDYGMLDIVAALEWVQRNIARFGGDPKRVTIFGQSGGGRKVNWLMVSPIVRDGLFHRAIPMSGSIRSVPNDEAEAMGIRLVEELGVNNLKELRAVPWRELVATAGKVQFSGRLVENGYSLLEPITTSFAKGLQKDVPYMIGMVKTEDEGHFNVPVDLLPNMKQRSAPVYAYTFTAVPAGWKKDGVTGWHAIDMAYLFGNAYENFTYAKPEYFRAYARRQGARNKDPGMTDADIAFARNFQNLWVQFARTGDPGIDGLVDWPAWDPEGDYYLELDNPLEVKQGYAELVHGE